MSTMKGLYSILFNGRLSIRLQEKFDGRKYQIASYRKIPCIVETGTEGNSNIRLMAWTLNFLLGISNVYRIKQ